MKLLNIRHYLFIYFKKLQNFCLMVFSKKLIGHYEITTIPLLFN